MPANSPSGIRTTLPVSRWRPIRSTRFSIPFSGSFSSRTSRPDTACTSASRCLDHGCRDVSLSAFAAPVCIGFDLWRDLVGFWGSYSFSDQSPADSVRCCVASAHPSVRASRDPAVHSSRRCARIPLRRSADPRWRTDHAHADVADHRVLRALADVPAAKSRLPGRARSGIDRHSDSRLVNRDRRHPVDSCNRSRGRDLPSAGFDFERSPRRAFRPNGSRRWLIRTFSGGSTRRGGRCGGAAVAWTAVRRSLPVQHLSGRGDVRLDCGWLGNPAHVAMARPPVRFDCVIIALGRHIVVYRWLVDVYFSTPFRYRKLRSLCSFRVGGVRKRDVRPDHGWRSSSRRVSALVLVWCAWLCAIAISALTSLYERHLRSRGEYPVRASAP